MRKLIIEFKIGGFFEDKIQKFVNRVSKDEQR